MIVEFQCTENARLGNFSIYSFPLAAGLRMGECVRGASTDIRITMGAWICPYAMCP
jgi:hypothetical protein